MTFIGYFYLLAQVDGEIKNKIGYISSLPANMAKDITYFENDEYFA